MTYFDLTFEFLGKKYVVSVPAHTENEAKNKLNNYITANCRIVEVATLVVDASDFSALCRSIGATLRRNRTATRLKSVD